jgi:hypothetical protein
VGGKEIFTALEITIIIIKIAGRKGERKTDTGLDSVVAVTWLACGTCGDWPLEAAPCTHLSLIPDRLHGPLFLFFFFFFFFTPRTRH